MRIQSEEIDRFNFRNEDRQCDPECIVCGADAEFPEKDPKWCAACFDDEMYDRDVDNLLEEE